MRHVAPLLLLGLVACAELKTASDAEEPTPAIAPASPTATKHVAKPDADDDDDATESAEPDARAPTKGSSGNGTATSSSPDGGTDGATAPDPSERDDRFCKARCTSEFVTCTSVHSPTQYSGCVKGCLKQKGPAALKYNETFLRAVEQCYATRPCETPITQCEQIYAPAKDDQTRSAIMDCKSNLDSCTLGVLAECDKLGNLDAAGQDASLTCMLKDCNDAVACFKTARGE